LVGGDGAVQGINSSGFMRGISLTVPTSTIRRVAETLVKHGKMRRGYLGVGAQPARLPEGIAQELDQEVGLLVVSVEKDSPAEKGGLFLGDVIVAVDGEATESLEELLALLGGNRVGTSVPVRVVRAGQLQDVNVTIGERN
jgi:S1-C subfamily serine protease